MNSLEDLDELLVVVAVITILVLGGSIETVCIRAQVRQEDRLVAGRVERSDKESGEPGFFAALDRYYVTPILTIRVAAPAAEPEVELVANGPPKRASHWRSRTWAGARKATSSGAADANGHGGPLEGRPKP